MEAANLQEPPDAPDNETSPPPTIVSIEAVRYLSVALFYCGTAFLGYDTLFHFISNTLFLISVSDYLEF